MAGELTITRVFEAPIEEVWKAWTDPTMLQKWWGPKDFTCPHADLDPKVGGKYLVSMKGPAGTPFDKEMWSTGTYKEIVPIDPLAPLKAGKIVVTDSFADEAGNIVGADYYGMPGTFPRESRVEITFEELPGNKTKMTLHYPSTAGIEGKMLEDMTSGWNQSFDKLASILSS